MRHRRRTKNVLTWTPVLIAVALVIAAFIYAPSLQPPPPRSRPAATAASAERLGPPAESSTREQSPQTTRTLEGATASAAERGAAEPQAGTAPPESAPRQTPQDPPRRKHVAAEPSRRAKAPRTAATAGPAHRPEDDASGDLNVRWNP